LSVNIDLGGQHALVTGASRGIGSAIAEALARAGALVALHYHENEEAAKKVARRLRNVDDRAEVPLLRADMGSPLDIWQMFDIYDSAFPSIDIVVCNAGVWKRAPIEKVSDDEVRETLAVNLEGVIHTCRLAAMRMIRQARGGSIVLVSSMAGELGEAYYSHYAASKGALIALARSLAVELAPHRIRVNAVAPGWIHTDMTREVLESPAGEAIRRKIPVGDAGQPKDVAGPVLFLVSSLASYVTGEVLCPNGGAAHFR
jgi:3-oxoacyl-[acyl-carrier protein] reductase